MDSTFSFVQTSLPVNHRFTEMIRCTDKQQVKTIIRSVITTTAKAQDPQKMHSVCLLF